MELSTQKPKYPSLKPSFFSSQDQFKEPQDVKSRNLKLQEQIRFREKFQLERDYQLIYSMPQQRIYGLMHFMCICSTIIILVFISMQFHRDMLDLEPITSDTNPEIPQYAIYTVAALIGAIFGSILLLIAQIPVRVYYSSVRQAYALFYYPPIGVFRQKKVLFRLEQYQIIPQKLDQIDSVERSIKIRINSNQSILRLKPSFYLIEKFFRSQRDIRLMRTKKIESDTIKEEEEEKLNQKQDEGDMWQTVMDKQQSSQRKTFK